MHTYKGYSVVPSMWLPGTSGLPGTIRSSGSSCGGDGVGRPLDQSCSLHSAIADVHQFVLLHTAYADLLCQALPRYPGDRAQLSSSRSR